jgi:VanZ family protein
MTRLTVLFRLAAWVFVAVLVLLTIAPPSARPNSGVPHHLEHFASFFIAGALWYMGYPRRPLLCLAFAIVFAGGLELIQLLVPGRHARTVDFFVDTLGAWTGSVAAFVIVRALTTEALRIKTAQPRSSLVPTSNQSVPVRRSNTEPP